MGDYDLIVALAAFWGAALSTIIFFLQLCENRPKIRINNRSYTDDTIEPIKDIYAISAINERKLPVTMACAYIEEYPKVKVGILPTIARSRKDTSIDGKQISYHQNITVEFEFPNDFKEIITPHNQAYGEKKQVIGVFVDQAGNIYKSKKPFWIG